MLRTRNPADAVSGVERDALFARFLRDKLEPVIVYKDALSEGVNIMEIMAKGVKMCIPRYRLGEHRFAWPS